MKYMDSWDTEKVFVIAEIGGNHEGDFEYALKLLKLASESGADAVKFQIYTENSLVNSVEDPERHTHFGKFKLTTDEYITLANEARESGIMFMASIWDVDQIDTFDPFMQIHKIGSGDLTAYPLIKKIVSKNKPTIISTGLSSLGEVLQTVQFIRECDPAFIESGKLALLQCTSMYPIPNCDANLKSIWLIREKTGLPVGYSDHTIGDYAIQVAVAMGACIIEKHFTDSRDGKTFRDHHVSLTKEEMLLFIEHTKKIIELQGSAEKRLMPSEADHLHSFRRAIYPRRDLSRGTLLQEEDLIVLRPCAGIGAEEFYNVIGRRLRIDKITFEKLDWQDLI